MASARQGAQSSSARRAWWAKVEGAPPSASAVGPSGRESASLRTAWYAIRSLRAAGAAREVLPLGAIGGRLRELLCGVAADDGGCPSE